MKAIGLKLVRSPERVGNTKSAASDYESAGSYTNAEAFTVLYERTHLIVFRYIYARCGEPQEDVEDLWIETFAKAWRSRTQFRGDEEAALGWLIHIARNLIIDRHRRKQRRPTNTLSDLEFIAAPMEDTPEHRIMAQEEQRALLEALDTLTDAQREMVILRYIVGWRVNQIADHLKMPENTVTVTLRRVLAKLADMQEKNP